MEDDEEDPLDILLSAASEELVNSKGGGPLTEIDLFGDIDDVDSPVVPSIKENKEDPLDILLSVASKELDNLKSGNKGRPLTEVNLFGDDEESPVVPTTKKSIIHSGDTDSSDEEGNRNYENKKYTDCGRDIKHLLDSSTENGTKQRISFWQKPPPTSTNSFVQSTSWAKKSSAPKPIRLPVEKADVYTDPIFGIRIINPLISSTLLQERMQGREAVSFERICIFLQMKGKEKDWAIAGVVVNKSAVKTSKKGSQYSIWTLSDLKGSIKTVALFLFSSAHKQLWKTSVGTVIGILNPNVLDKRDGAREEATLSIDTHQKVMIFGQSKDFGLCKSLTKSGEKCTAIVNKNSCEFCLYHIKQEYQKCSQRSELQSNFAGKGLTALRNKVLGKNEVFYEGKSYMAIPARKSRKMTRMDSNRLECLSSKSNGATTTKPVQKKRLAASKLDVSQAQRMKDIDLLKKLGSLTDFGHKDTFSGNRSTDITLEESKSVALAVINKLKAKTTVEKPEKVDIEPLDKDLSNGYDDDLQPTAPNEKIKPTLLFNNSPAPTFPKLSGFEPGNLIDLSKPMSRRMVNAKSNAIKLIKKSGPIKKSDPNNTRGSGKKRAMDETPENGVAKKSKLAESEFISDRFKKMMAMSSKHTDLLEARDEEAQQKYFDKLEAKERMEEKMTNTFKVACKAVRCLTCKYTSFSASDRCKTERHPLRVYDAMKRFFKCGKCGNRTVSLEVVPTRPCANCGSGKWEKTGMMKEKVVTAAHSLSIRGGEQKFANSVVADANINLLVPES